MRVDDGHLHGDETLITIVCDHDFLGKEVSTDGSLVLIVELAVHIPTQKGRKSHIAMGL